MWGLSISLSRAGFLTVSLLAVHALHAPGAHAQEMEVRFSADLLTRLSQHTLFAHYKGRLYLEGNESERCRYAFLEYPQITFDPPRVVLKAHLSARKGKMILGSCVGPGESFNVEVSATPEHTETSIVFDDIQLIADKNVYNKLIRKFFKLPANVEYSLDQIPEKVGGVRVSVRPTGVTVSGTHLTVSLSVQLKGASDEGL